MSLTSEIKPDLVRPKKFHFLKQTVLLKLRMHSGMLIGLLVIQLLLLSSNLFRAGTSATMHGVGRITIHLDMYNVGEVLFGTFLWAFIAGAMLASGEAKQSLYSFIVDHQTNQLANALVLVFMSVIASVTVTLLGIATWVLIVLLKGIDAITYAEVLTIPEFILGLCLTFFYVLLISILGYFLANFAQLPQLILVFSALLVLITIVIWGLLGVMVTSEDNLMYQLFMFYYKESNALLFCLKLLIPILLFYCLAYVLTSRREAR